MLNMTGKGWQDLSDLLQAHALLMVYQVQADAAGATERYVYFAGDA